MLKMEIMELPDEVGRLRKEALVRKVRSERLFNADWCAVLKKRPGLEEDLTRLSEEEGRTLKEELVFKYRSARAHERKFNTDWLAVLKAHPGRQAEVMGLPEGGRRARMEELVREYRSERKFNTDWLAVLKAQPGLKEKFMGLLGEARDERAEELVSEHRSARSRAQTCHRHAPLAAAAASTSSHPSPLESLPAALAAALPLLPGGYFLPVPPSTAACPIPLDGCGSHVTTPRGVGAHTAGAEYAAVGHSSLLVPVPAALAAALPLPPGAHVLPVPPSTAACPLSLDGVQLARDHAMRPYTTASPAAAALCAAATARPPQ